ncbi:alpha-L-rhamnosidase [Streptomyces brasiliscabiei]|uniref:alpha-L-rhamnosidase n=1 Tax=Streptomyces brasiliscabiei TaxID=2736302 RepID=UPI001C1091D9|nr:alpha-L-rhamnosidase [Streptomyces brasiliscabiei]
MPEALLPAPAVARLRFEHHREPLGIGESRPRLSWTIRTELPGWRQAAYEIQRLAAQGDVVTTAAAESDESVLVAWPFDALASRERVGVRVRVRGTDGTWSRWSEPAFAETGLLHPDDWQARFVSADWDEDAQQDQPATHLRRGFTIRPGVAAARLYATAHGVYEAELNGSPVGDHVLAPGWTTYGKRLRYQTYDVTALLQDGENKLTALLADGWYRGRLGFTGDKRAVYGDRLAWLAQLEIRYTDGSTDTVTTDADGRWQAAQGPIRRSSLYDGETHDARVEPTDWRGVRVEERDPATLVAPVGPPVRRIEELAPTAVTTSPSGRTIVDFGQNLVGRLRLTVTGQAGQEVVLRHAEVLEDGELATAPLRSAQATDRYILRGGDPETFEPRFTFHGFRYAEITGWPGELNPDDVRAVVIHSDLERTGTFESSDELLNQLHQNVVWGMRGNFLDVPTDCPQRDERLGWTGDIQVFAPTAAYLYDSAGFLTSWLADLAADQGENGGVPFVVPKCVDGADTPTAAWGDAATIVPWVLHHAYGDLGLLAAQFESMRGWVDHVASLAGESRLWDSGFQFGDWLDPNAPAGRPDQARTPGEIVATAYFARSAEIVSQSARLLGREADAVRYGALAAEVRQAFASEYVTGAGRMMADAPTAYALALQFALLPDQAQRAHAGKRLAGLVRAGGYKISTGFVGTPLICDALAETGHLDAAYRLLLQTEQPSWLHPVTQGATTIWERWDSLLPDGKVNPSGMTSFNHYALGAVADWLHRTVAGLAPAEPGYRKLRLAPRPGGGLTRAQAALLTPYGRAEIAWRLDGEELHITALVPPNTSAVVDLPGPAGPPFDVTAGHHTWTVHLPATAPPSGPVTLDTTLGELMDRPGAMKIFTDTLVRYFPEAAAYIDQSDTESGETTIRDAAAMVPGGPEFLCDLEEQYAAFNAAASDAN